MRRPFALLLATILALSNTGSAMAGEILVDEEIVMDTESFRAEEEPVQEVDSEELASGDIYIGEELSEEAVTEDITSSDISVEDAGSEIDVLEESAEGSFLSEDSIIDSDTLEEPIENIIEDAGASQADNAPENEESVFDDEDFLDEPAAVGAAPSGILGNGTNGITIDINSAPYTTFATYSYGQYAYGREGCAWFASARVNQLTGKGSTIFSGWAWYYSQYPNYGFSIGSEPRAKALACYGNHVAVVEAVNGDTITVSQGGMGGLSDANHGYCIISTMSRYQLEHQGGCGEFYGYVYLDGATPSPTSFYYSSPGVNPQGCLDFAEGGNGTLHIKGWAFDRNSDEALKIHVYVGGSAASGQAIWSTGEVVANKYRPDVNNIYPGAGDYHGFEETFTVPFTGTYDVYVYAINVGGKGTSTNYNPLLDGGPKQATVTGQTEYHTLDVNGFFEGKDIPDLGDMGTFDVWINDGRVAADVNDYYATLPVGTYFEIKVKQSNYDYIYDGLKTGSLEGTIGNEDIIVSLQFSKRINSYQLTFDLDGGYCDDDLIDSKYVNSGEKYGALPVPKKDGYLFGGWVDRWGWVNSTAIGTRYYYDSIFEKKDLTASWYNYTPQKDIYNNHEYYVFDCNMSWTEAQQYCAKKGGHLVTIEDENELEAIKSFVSFSPLGCFYIGASDEDNDGFWEWVTDEPFSYTNWNGYKSHRSFEEYAAIINNSDNTAFHAGEWITTTDAYTGSEFFHYSNCGFIMEVDYVHTPISECEITLEQDTFPYTGKMPSFIENYISVRYNGVTLRENVDYKIALYMDYGIDIGTHYIVITGIGLYEGTSYQTYYIVDPSEYHYTINYDANGGTNAPPAQEKEHGTELIITTEQPIRTGYTFIGWSTSRTATTAEYAAGANYIKNEAVTLYAVWKKNVYIITYNANGGSKVPSAQTKEHGITLKLTTIAPVRTGYAFQGWTTTSTGTTVEYAAGADYTKNESVTLYAVWKLNTYTITYNANGGTNAPASQVKNHGTDLKLSPQRPTKTGFTFLGWATSPSAKTPEYASGTSYSVDENIILYAVWNNGNTYEISYDANGGINAPASQKKTHSTAISLTLETPSRTGYNFLGWSEDMNAVSADYQRGAEFTQDKDTILYAVWELKTYQVKYDANGGSGAPSAQQKEYGKALTLSTKKPTRAGYTFLGWGTAKGATDAKYQPGGKYTANSVVTLYAVWEINTYSIVYDANGGDGAPDEQVKTYGESLEIAEDRPVKNGYNFLGWSEDANAATAEYTAGDYLEEDRDFTLYAVWEAKTYTIKYNANGGSNAPASQKKTHGKTLKLSAAIPVRDEYEFLGWSSDKNAETAQFKAGADYTANKSVTLYAVWKEKTTERQLFDDVTDPDLFYFEPVYWAVDNGITTGYSDNTFRPSNLCHRAAVVTFLWRLAGKPDEGISTAFSDMTGNDDFDRAITWASNHGITTGYNDGTFRPYNPCHRAAIVTFIWRYAGKPEPSSAAGFSDMTNNVEFDKAIAWAAENNITTGYNDGTFRPYNSCLRLAVVTFLYRYVHL